MLSDQLVLLMNKELLTKISRKKSFPHDENQEKVDVTSGLVETASLVHKALIYIIFENLATLK